jgi:transposase
MRPYSIDLRKKVVEIWEQEKVSIRKLAVRFGVAKSFVQKIIKQYQETGDIAPRRPGGSPPLKLNAEQLLILVEIIENNNDATLEELCDLLEKKTGIRVGKSTMWRISHKLNYTVKKTLICSRKGKARSTRKKSRVLASNQRNKS